MVVHNSFTEQCPEMDPLLLHICGDMGKIMTIMVPKFNGALHNLCGIYKTSGNMVIFVVLRKRAHYGLSAHPRQLVLPRFPTQVLSLFERVSTYSTNITNRDLPLSSKPENVVCTHYKV